MRELLLRDKKWEFYLNPASSELPLMAVGEIEELARIVGGSIIDNYATARKFYFRHKKISWLTRLVNRG